MAELDVAEYRAVAAQRIQHLVRVDQPLMLIAQPLRSGGTLLLRLFDAHPQCHSVPYELQRMFTGMAKDLGDPDAAWQALSSPKQFERRRPFVLTAGLQRSIFDAVFAELDDPAPRAVMDCWFTSFFNGWLDNANLRAEPKRWVVGFEPGGTTRLDVHRRLYPDGRVISIVRDPWSWYSSVRRFKPKKWQDRAQTVETWCVHTRAAIAAQAEDPARVTLVRFSDLLGRTEPTMRMLAAWLGIDFLPGLLTPSFNGMATRAKSSFRDVGTEVSTAPLERAKDLTGEDSAYVEARAGALYEEALAGTLVVEPAPAGSTR